MRRNFIILALLLAKFSFGQEPGYAISQLKDNSDRQVLIRVALYDSLNKLDTNSLVRFIGELEMETARSSPKIKARVLALKARLLFYQLGPGDSLYGAQMKMALYKAYDLDESFMIAEYGRWYSEMIKSLHKGSESIQYALSSIVLQEQLGIEYFTTVNTFYFTIGEILLRTRNYDDAVKWLNKGLAFQRGDSMIPANYANALNNLALSYYYLKDYHKCLEIHEQCMAYSREHHLEDWYYTSYYNRINCFMELEQYDSCKYVLDRLYNASKEENNYATMAGICYNYGQIANRKKDFAAALDWLKKAETYADKTGLKYYRTTICKELSTCYDGLKQFDKSLAYYKEYKLLDEESAKRADDARSDFAMAKANFEKEQLAFKDLKAKRVADIRLRNAGIVILALLSGLVIWWLNRKRKKARRDAEKQLNRFAENIISKDLQIEALKNEREMQSHNTETAAKVEELSQQMILTEDDWKSFQSLFNKTYPGFLHRLKEKFTGITEAEIRMACLIKIRLTTKQIASMQGISPDSVHKTRHRLRQRFATSSTAELEAIIANV